MDYIKKDQKFHTIENKCLRDFIRKSIKSGRVYAFIGSFESKQFDEILLNIKKHLSIYDIEISTLIDKYLEYIAIKEKENQTVFVGDENDYCKKGQKGMEEFINKHLVIWKIKKHCRGQIGMFHWFHMISTVYIRALKLINIVHGRQMKHLILLKNI